MRRVNIPAQEADLRYSNWISTLIDLLKPSNLYLIGGRGTAKSTDILAKRAIDVIYDMPRASFAFVSDTYVNLMTNIIPAIILGWESRHNFYEQLSFRCSQGTARILAPAAYQNLHVQTYPVNL